jgi:hypothetical protein
MTQVLTDQLEEQYLNAASEYAAKWNCTDSHVIRIIQSVMLHRDELRPGGGFVEAVVNNNLLLAISRADNTCYANLKTIVSAKEYCYV